jgi:hypothetical protein
MNMRSPEIKGFSSNTRPLYFRVHFTNCESPVRKDAQRTIILRKF